MEDEISGKGGNSSVYENRTLITQINFVAAHAVGRLASLLRRGYAYNKISAHLCFKSTYLHSKKRL